MRKSWIFLNLVMVVMLMLTPCNVDADDVTNLLNKVKKDYAKEKYDQALEKLEQVQQIIKLKAVRGDKKDLPIELKITKTFSYTGSRDYPVPCLEGYLTLLKPHKEDYYIKYKLKCMVENKKRVASSTMMILLDQLEVGEETKWKDNVPDFDLRGASQCEIVFKYGPMFDQGKEFKLLEQSVTF